MKRLFYALCLLNAGFFLWQFHLGRFDAPLDRQDSSPSILLVSEYRRAERGAEISGVIDSLPDSWRQPEIRRILSDLKGEQWELKPIAVPETKKAVIEPEVKPRIQPPKETPKPAPIVETVVKVCVEVGPFPDESALKTWLAGKPVLERHVVQKEAALPTDYQVYYPAAKTQEQSQSDKAMLTSQGIKDIWKIPDGDLKGSYSLGVFKEKQRALILKGQMAEKGVRAQIKQREKKAMQWFAKLIVDKAKLEQIDLSAFQSSSCRPD